jgi:membrane-bound ClpP family serine protease
MSALGLLLVLVGAALVVAEAHLPSHGALGTGAVAALALGVALTLAGSGTATGVAVAGGLGIGLAGALCVWILVRKALATRRLIARNGLVGKVGRVKPSGQVFLDNGLTLTVRHAEEWEVAS